jgi:hypothetical protein
MSLFSTFAGATPRPSVVRSSAANVRKLGEIRDLRTIQRVVYAARGDPAPLLDGGKTPGNIKALLGFRIIRL